MRPLETSPKLLGEKLRTLRRSQAVSLEMLEKMTRVRKCYLEALEWGRYDELPDPMYTRNYLRSYSRALKADETYFLELYEEESGRVDLLSPHRLPRERVNKRKFFVATKAMSALVLASFALCVIAYLGYQANRLLAAPNITLLNPQDSSAVSSALLPVSGFVTDKEVQVKINGKDVVVRDDDSFATTLDLSNGLNVITVEAKRRYSHTATILRRVVLDQTEVQPVSLR
ncbi:MAG: helix-turn-helix domain-containing protein [Patescibacteria group bacterium]